MLSHVPAHLTFVATLSSTLSNTPHNHENTQDTLRRLARPTAILGRRWDGLKRKKPLQSLVWDGGTAGTGGGGYATFPSRHWTLNCLLSRQRNRAPGKLCRKLCRPPLSNLPC